MGDLSRRYPDDLDAAVIYAESLMNLTPWKLWTSNGTPASNTELIVGVLESVMLRNPESPGRESLLHSRRRGLAHTGARAAERAAPGRPRGIVRAPAPYAGAHLRAYGRSCGSGCGKRSGCSGRSPLSRHRAGKRDVRNDVLPAQPALPRRLAHDAGAVRRCEAGGRSRRRTGQPPCRDDADGGIGDRHAGVGAAALRAVRRSAGTAGATRQSAPYRPRGITSRAGRPSRKPARSTQLRPNGTY